jgi:hypothetical protein
MRKLIEEVNGVTVYTKHFIATADMRNGTFTVFGDFNDTEVMRLDEPDRCKAITTLITELTDLEEMLRRLTAEDK